MIDNLMWAVGGFVFASALFAIFYDWSISVVGRKWAEVCAANLAYCRLAVIEAYREGKAGEPLRVRLQTTSEGELLRRQAEETEQ